AEELVVALAAVEHVVAALADQEIVPRSAEKRIVEAPAEETVAALVTADHVPSAAADDAVGAGRAVELVVGAGARERDAGGTGDRGGCRPSAEEEQCSYERRAERATHFPIPRVSERPDRAPATIGCQQRKMPGVVRDPRGLVLSDVPAAEES